MYVYRVCVFFVYLFVIDKSNCRSHVLDCSVANGSAGVCVQIDGCPSLLPLLSVPSPLPRHIADKLKYHTTCGFENGMPKLCCLDDFFTTEETPFPSYTVPPISSTEYQPSPSTQLPASERRVDLPEDVSDHPNLNLLPQNSCGYSLKRNLRVAKGIRTILFEFPWMALLRYKTGVDIESLCGGTVISDRYVLTAAHCIPELESTDKIVAVRLGEYDTTTDTDCPKFNEECAPPVQDIPIEEVFVHPMFKRPITNDIAVIRLAKPANMTPESVRPICLPTTFQLQNKVLRHVLITGWGVTETRRPATILLKASLPIVPNDICQAEFYKRSLEPTQMCAGSETADTCKGDSGGPLMYRANMRMVQFGIVSGGTSLCDRSSNYPSIYTNVPYYMSWILSQMRP